ncbi:hypothetical protein BGW39_006757 [Mortierella sp. 14UC]|nr:hypothetical protein BGW39_006757 [Mortierella sp. 14UC]
MHRDATVRYIVNYLEKLRPRLLVILWVEVALEDATLAKLLNCVRLAGCIDSDGDSMDVVQSRGGGQHYKQEQQEQHQYGWRRLKLHGSSPLGPLSSAALIAQCPTLKSLEVVKCYSCPSQVLANILTTSPGLEILTTIEDFKNGEDDYEYTYNHVDARQLLEMTRTTNAGAGGAAWACKELKTLKLVISNIPRPDCKRTQYRARVSATKNGTKGLTGDIEEQALRMQRVICGQLGRLTKLEVLWLGRETRDFRNLDNYRVVPESRREELGLRKRDPNRGDDDKIEKDNEVEEVEDGEAEEAEDEDVEEEEEEEEEVEEAMDYEDDLDHDIEDEYDSDADTDKHGKPLMYPLMFLNPRFQFSCLPLSLASGLDLMSGLKELRELNVEEMAHLIGVEEVRWMVEHWPKLSRVIGLAVKGEVNDAVEWLKQARPWIELPESCNSMRQSTWEYYYPPKRSY